MAGANETETIDCGSHKTELEAARAIATKLRERAAQGRLCFHIPPGWNTLPRWLVLENYCPICNFRMLSDPQTGACPQFGAPRFVVVLRPDRELGTCEHAYMKHVCRYMSRRTDRRTHACRRCRHARLHVP